MKLPLEGLTVLEFCQYLAGPAAGLRLADLGARVIKIERPQGGDACRQLAIKNLFVDGDSTVFHTVNRNKDSYAADLKNPDDLQRVKQLISRADVLTHNFRPGVMDKIGLDYERVREINPRLVYAEVSGYGKVGPWRGKPGQDLLAQSMSGLTWLSGSAGDGPTPFGLAMGDMLCGAHLVQGILAALVRRGKTGQGCLVEVSLMESLIDFQFEVLTTHFQDGETLPQRAAVRNAHAYLSAPYGIYQTSDGWLAIAMGSLSRLAECIGCRDLDAFLEDPEAGFERRDEIKSILAGHFLQRSTADWLAILEPADYWCSEVLDYRQLTSHEAWRSLAMDQTVRRGNGTEIRTLRCPIRIDGERIFSPKAAPVLGENTTSINSTL